MKAVRNRTVAIIGVGMMGGSLAQALRDNRWHVTALVSNRAKKVFLKRLGLTDEVSVDWPRTLGQVSVVVVCTPVSAVASTIKRILPWLRPGTLVMDISSVKGKIIQDIAGEMLAKKSIHFVGSHPMVGSEKTGPVHSNKALFEGSACVLTPGKSTAAQAVARAKYFWRSIGARVLLMRAVEHDRLVASTSHLPHFLASALLLHVADVSRRDVRVKAILAGSFRDMTRIASADSLQWCEILQANRVELQKALKYFYKTLKRLENSLVSSAALEKLLSRSKETRAAFSRG